MSEKWRLNGTIISNATEVIIYGVRSFRMLKKNMPISFMQFLAEADLGITDFELNNYCQDKMLYEFISMIKQKGLLVKYNQEYKDTPLEKSYDYFKFFCSDLFEFNSSPIIAIIGCGGVGANVAINLLLSGFNKFILVDFDLVSNSNLNRQYPYTKYDVGQKKTLALKKHLLSYELNDLEIDCYDFVVDSIDALESHINKTVDFVVCGIDVPIYKSKLILSEYAMKYGVPIIFGGCGYEQIFFGPLIHTKESFSKYITYLNKKCLLPQNKAISGSIPSLNNLLTAVLTQEVINFFYKIIKCESIDRVISLSAFTYEKSELIKFNS